MVVLVSPTVHSLLTIDLSMSSDHTSHAASKNHEAEHHGSAGHTHGHSHGHASHGHSGEVVCHKCHEHLTEHDHFCHACGAEVEIEHTTCHSCHTEQLASNAFCIGCGAKIGHHGNKKSLQFFIVLVVLVALSVLVIVNSVTPSTSLGVVSPDSETEISSLDGAQVSSKYREIAFNTLIFAGEVTHEAEIVVPSPTNQRFTLESVKAFLSNSVHRIQPEDIVEIDVYEEGKEKSDLLGHFVVVDTALHENYKFPSKGFTSVGGNVWVNWGSYRTLKNIFN